jgi:hypothetical protein
MNLKTVSLFVAVALSLLAAGCVTNDYGSARSNRSPKYPAIHPWEENCMKGPFQCGGSA